MAFNFSVPAFAAENEDMLTNTFIEDDEDIQDNEYVPNDEYILIDAIETPYGTAYYVQLNDGIQTATIWDLVDINQCFLLVHILDREGRCCLNLMK